MEPLKLSEAAGFTAGRLRGDDIEITSVGTDSRAMEPGGLFVPLAGERADGHDFIKNAAKTCAAALSQRETDADIPVIFVEDTRQALGALAAGYKRKLAVKTAAVTGSVGKTTTKEMLAAMLSRQYATSATRGNYNNDIGVPLTLLSLDGRTQAAVVEMGMNHFGEISRLSKMTAPDLGLITFAGTQHIEFLGSREGIVKAKLEILDGMPPQAPLVLNGDCPLLWKKREELERPLIYFGVENPACAVTARSVRLTENGSSFTLAWPGGTLEARIPVPGVHNVQNALGAAAAALEFGVTAENIALALEGFENTGMRQRIYESGGFTIIEDCYNAGPESMAASLAVLEGRPGRKIAVLGDMLELGDRSGELHRQALERAMAAAELVLLYGPAMGGAVRPGDPGVSHFDSHKALAEALRAACTGGETILFKGSRGMTMEKALKLFTDGE